MAEVRIEGLEQFRKDLERLDFSKRQAALEAAGIKVVEPLRLKASAFAPRDTGFLSKQILSVVDKKESDIETLTILVGPSIKAFYGMFQEFGTAHNPPQEFMQPAIEEASDDVLNNFGDVLQEEIDRALRI